MVDLRRKLLAETLGTALLLAVVIGSGIMAERLSGGNVAIALLANTLATVGGLYILIEVFGPVSGAHFNPAVSAVMAVRGELARLRSAPTSLAQLVGAMLGAWLAHAMFDMSDPAVLDASAQRRRAMDRRGGRHRRAAAGHPARTRMAARPRWSRATSAPPTGSPRRPRSPTRPPRSAACSATALPASRPAAWPGFVVAQLIGALIGLGIHRALGRPGAGHPNVVESSGEVLDTAL